MADCVYVLPEDIMLCILTRLPVKSLLRFKSVCKLWRELFATPDFIKMHHRQFSSDPKNDAFIIDSFLGLNNLAMSLFSIESKAKKPTNLDLPFPESSPHTYYAWCCNGLVCMAFIPLDMGIIALWNPALRLSKFVQLPEGDVGLTSLGFGFGYDTEGDDFKVVRMVRWKGETTRVGVEVYSAKSNSWKTIKVGFQFWLWNRSSDIVNGNPFWIVSPVDGNVSLMWCDVTKLEFKMVPLSNLIYDRLSEIQCVYWKGSLAALSCSRNKEGLDYVDVWVFDDGEMIWRKKYTFGPMEIGVDMYLNCSKNGIIMGECDYGKLFVLDPQSGWVKKIEPKGQRGYFKIYGYNESLVHIKGMEQV